MRAPRRDSCADGSASLLCLLKAPTWGGRPLPTGALLPTSLARWRSCQWSTAQLAAKGAELAFGHGLGAKSIGKVCAWNGDRRIGSRSSWIGALLAGTFEVGRSVLGPCCQALRARCRSQQRHPPLKAPRERSLARLLAALKPRAERLARWKRGGSVSHRAATDGTRSPLSFRPRRRIGWCTVALGQRGQSWSPWTVGARRPWGSANPRSTKCATPRTSATSGPRTAPADDARQNF